MSSCVKALCSVSIAHSHVRGSDLVSGRLCFRGAAIQKEFFPLTTLGEDQYCLLGLHPPLQAFRPPLRSEGVLQPQFG